MLKAFVVTAAATVACALHSGQGERVGFHGVPESGPDEYASAELSPSDFWDKYVQGMEPVVIRGAVKADPAVKLWTDDYMIGKYGDMKVRVEPKIEGGSRSVEAGEMPSNLKLRDFYNKWFDEAYVVTQIPRPMANETTIASVMSCGPITDQFVEMNLWISKATSGVTSSQIHKDSNNQMNCLYQGTKQWTMFAPEHGPDMYLIQEQPGQDQTYDTAGMSQVGVLEVDFKRYPRFAKVPFKTVVLQPGDCLYVPGSYMHHVYSTGSRNIQVTQLFSGPEVATSIERIQKPRHARPTWTQADHLGHPCKGPGARFPNLPRNLAISEVDIAWDFDGYGPITMGFSGPSGFAARWKSNVKNSFGQTLKPGDLERLFLAELKHMDSCPDPASFPESVELHRHVYEALDVLVPERAGQHQWWNGSCANHVCTVPDMCSFIKRHVTTAAHTLFERLSEDGGKTAPVSNFMALTRRELQDTFIGTFVYDQVASVGLQGGGGGGSDNGEEDGAEDEPEEEEEEERRGGGEQEDDEDEESEGERDEL